MVKMKSDKESDNLIKDLVDTKLLRYTIQIFLKNTKLKPFGSGILAFIHEKYFLLTASHVAEFLSEDKHQLWLQIGKNDYINLLGEIKLTEIKNSNNIDLAYIKLDSQLIPLLNKSYSFLTIDKFSKHNKILDEINYCILGFPENNIKEKEGLIETGASYYLTSALNKKPYDFYKLNDNDFIILNMTGKGFDIFSGERKKINTHFYGISGCGLWLLDFFKYPETGKLTVDYRLIGIMTEFKKGKYFCLIANKIHLILEAMQIYEGFKFTAKRKL